MENNYAGFNCFLIRFFFEKNLLSWKRNRAFEENVEVRLRYPRTQIRRRVKIPTTDKAIQRSVLDRHETCLASKAFRSWIYFYITQFSCYDPLPPLHIFCSKKNPPSHCTTCGIPPVSSSALLVLFLPSPSLWPLLHRLSLYQIQLSFRRRMSHQASLHIPFRSVRSSHL